MHETSIMYSAMEIVLEKAKESNLKKINRITLKIGELTGVMPEVLYFAYENASKGTIAEGAEFHIDRVKATARCDKCDIIFDIDHFNKLCPDCSTFSSDILSGYELNVNTIDGE
ncbi:MAG: hydrogenase maturation nickel metallochaperone HypA [Clostridia bacterium]|nr:hydrogenase maturation nickel metallochaperone HypA [Clostridia bacterium]